MNDEHYEGIFSRYGKIVQERFRKENKETIAKNLLNENVSPDIARATGLSRKQIDELNE